MSLPAVQRLRRTRDFRNTYTRGRSVANGKLVLYHYSRGDDEPNRTGFSISKKVGNAVVRNRTRRRLQGIVGEISPLLRNGSDLVWIVRPRTGRIEFNDLRVSALALLSRAGLLKGRK